MTTGYVEIGIIPSPYEIEISKTKNGGWDKKTLSRWGVSFPPVHGWKECLEEAHKNGLTVGVVLECIGCRKAKYFSEYEDCPVCNSCREWEENTAKRIHDSKFPVTQKHSFYRKEKIPPDIRWAVWERDNFTCKHCGARKNLSVDHIIPESKGGKTTMENCQTLCKSCNSRKGAR